MNKIVIFCLFCFLGCQGTWVDKTETALDATVKTTSIAFDIIKPAYEAHCMEIQKKCTTNPCDELAKCQEERNKVYEALTSIVEGCETIMMVLPNIQTIVERYKK